MGALCSYVSPKDLCTYKYIIMVSCATQYHYTYKKKSATQYHYIAFYYNMWM